MSWVAVAIGGAAVLGAGTAVYLDSTSGGGGGGGDQYGGTQTVRSSSTAMPRPSEYDAIFNEFLRGYFGDQVLGKGRTDEMETLAERITKQKERLAEVETRITQEGLTPALLQDREGTNAQIKELRARYDAYDLGVTPYEQALKTFTEEKTAAQKAYLEQLTGLKEPLLSNIEAAMGKHAGTLDEIITKRMAGEAVGPYAADIDKLLGERTGVSFGGADPMQFITGSQQRLLSDLMGAQETGLSNIALTSLGRSEAEKEPAALRYGMERELADLGLAAFTPSNVSELAYLQDLRSMWEPMEFARYTAQPSTETTTTGLPTAQGSSFLDQLQQIMNMGQGAASWAGLLKSFVPTSTPYTAPSVPTSTFPTSFSIGG